MQDDIQSDSEYDNPYIETALDWHQRNQTRLALKRCGMYSSDDDDSFDEHHDLEGENSLIFHRWMQSYPTIATRCSLFLQPQSTNRKSAREQEAKSLHRVLRKLSKEKTDKGNNSDVISSEEMKYHERVANSFLPRGLGISFMDAVLSSSFAKSTWLNGQQKQGTFCRTVLEITGPARTGMTSILVASVARYVANTSSIFLEIQDSNVNSHIGERFTNLNTVIDNPHGSNKLLDTLNIAEPRVVFLDLEHGVHTKKVILSIREAVLHRWEETSLARKWRKQHDIQVANRVTNISDENDTQHLVYATQEQHQIERAIASCLGRIHIIQPRDFTYLSLVATIEVLNKRLSDDKLYQQTSQQQPPTLLIIDSISTLDACTRAQENLPTISGSTGGSGLSERNEFYRQLVRLRDEHEVAIFGSSRKMHTEGDSSTIWDKLVTHHIELHHVAEGTNEANEGFDFAATVKNNQGDKMFPFSVTSGGIHSWYGD